jgi:hypothetical protein
MKFLLLLALAFPSLAFADLEFVYQNRYHYVITDAPCDFSNPDNLPLKDAYATDVVKGTQVDGCAVEDGEVYEFQLYNTNKEFFGFKIPKNLFKEVDKI